MKVIKYTMCNRVNIGTEDNSVWKDRPGNKVEIRCEDENLAANEEIAKREAYNGEYTVEEA